MSVILTVNGQEFEFPVVPEEGWGEEVTAWAAAITSGMVPKIGGEFTLTDNVDFGPTAGVFLKHVISKSLNPASTGIIRLANGDSITWRDLANASDLALSISSDRLRFKGIEIVDISTAQTLSSKTLESPVINGTLTGTAILDENDLQSNSSVKVPTQKSVKTYVDTRVAGSSIKVKLYDPQTTELPTGIVVIDGITISDNDDVLFTNLDIDPNRIYAATVVAGEVTEWTPQIKFTGDSLDPAKGEAVRISDGDIFNTQLAVFDGTEFSVNKIVRYFNGADFLEQSSLYTSNLDGDNDLFSVAQLSSENWEISYSLKGSTGLKEIGSLYLTLSESEVKLSRIASPESNDLGVEFEATSDGTDVTLSYTNAPSGTTMKYHYKRWSDGPGGPSAVPTYVTGGSSTTPSAGVEGCVQIAGSSGFLDSDTRIKWDKAEGILNLDGFKIHPLRSNTLEASILTPTTILSLDSSTNKFITIDYSLEGSNGEVQVGRIFVTHNGTITSLIDQNTFTSVLGATFSSIIDGSDLLIQYINESAIQIQFKHSVKRWS